MNIKKLKSELQRFFKSSSIRAGEIFFVLILIFLAYLFRETPISAEKTPVKTPKPQVPAQAVTEPATESITLPPLDAKYSNIKKRNLFTPEGSYTDQKIPEIPYTVVAIKIGKPNQAILKLYTGELITVKKGDKLIDEAQVLEIKEKYIKIKRLDKTKKLTLFGGEIEKWQLKK